MLRNALVLAVLVTLSSPAFALPPAHDALPLSFIPNNGLTDAPVQFLARGKGYGLFLSPGTVTLVLQEQFATERGTESSLAGLVELAFVDANVEGQFEGIEALPGRAHFLHGKDPSAWRTNLPTFASTRYPDLYPGIDLLLYGDEGELEYDLVVAPGRDPSSIRLDIRAGSPPELDPDTGGLVLRLGENTLLLKKPFIYQERNGARLPISGKYVFDASGHTTFEIDDYDESLPLVIDPVLIYSSYIGGGQNAQPFGSPSDSVEAVAADAGGSAYIAGRTQTLDFPNTINPQAFVRGSDAFVAKVSPDGQLVYSTFFGGARSEVANGIAVDDQGHALVAGITSSTDFPVLNAAQGSFGGSFEDLFVAKLSPDGSQFVFSTYLGGSGKTLADNCGADLEISHGISVDAAGSAYVTGYTCSRNFPTTPGAYDETKGPGQSPTVTKYNPAGQIVYSTFLGGRFSDEPQGIVVDSAGRAWVAGEAISDDYPTTANALQSTIVSAPEGFVTQLSADGSALEYSTYLGGAGADSPNEITLDGQGNVIVAGSTASGDFPVAGTVIKACQSSLFSPGDAFVTKIHSSTGSLIFSSCVGGSNDDRALGVAVDSYDNIWVTGRTDSSDFPTTMDALQLMPPGAIVAFLTSLASDGSTLLYSTYFGGSGGDVGIGLAHSPGSLFVGGLTGSTDFPLANPFQGQNAGSSDGFISRIEYNEEPTSDAGGPYDVDEGDSVQLMAFGSDPEGNTPIFDWDLNDDGTFETPGESVPFSAASIDGPSTVAVAVRVTDDIGLTSTSATTVEVHNVAPTSTFSNVSGTLVIGATPVATILDFDNQTDPSPDDVAAGFIYSYDCDGDMLFEITGSATDSQNCVYTSAGSLTAGGRIEDKDGGFTDYTATVEILTPRDGIVRLIEKVNTIIAGGGVSMFFGRLMLAPLNIALVQFDRGNIGATVGALNVFRFITRLASIFGGLSGQDRDQLLDCADQVIAALGG